MTHCPTGTLRRDDCTETLAAGSRGVLRPGPVNIWCRGADGTRIRWGLLISRGAGGMEARGWDPFGMDAGWRIWNCWDGWGTADVLAMAGELAAAPPRRGARYQGLGGGMEDAPAVLLGLLPDRHADGMRSSACR